MKRMVARLLAAALITSGLVTAATAGGRVAQPRGLQTQGEAAAPAATGSRPRLLMPGSVNDPGSDTTPLDSQRSTSLVNAGNGRLVTAFKDDASVAQDWPRWLGYAFSTNNGASWLDGGNFRPLDPIPRGVWPPVLAADPAANRVYLASANMFSNGISVLRSTNGGQSWLSAQTDGKGQNFTTSGAVVSWIAVDRASGAGQSNVYLCFGDGTSMRFTRSIDKGLTFTPAGGFNLGATDGHTCTVAVGPQHDVYVFYVRSSGPTKQLVMRRSTNRGVNFGPVVVMRNLLSPNSYGAPPINGGGLSVHYSQAAINPDPAKPWIYVAYHDSPAVATGADNGNIYIIYSKDRGLTWSAPVTVDASARDQFNPVAGFASPGNLMVAYSSRVQDIGNSHLQRRARIGKLTSTGAIAWNPSFQLGPNTRDASKRVQDLDVPDGNGQFDGMTAVSGKWATTWSDARKGDAFFPFQSDIRFAAVSVPTAANLGVALSASTSAMAPADQRRVRVRLTSAGGVSRDTYVNIVAPFGMGLQPPGGLDCAVDGRFLGCAAGDIPAGGTRDFYFNVTADETAGARQIRAYATTSSRDTTQSNNSATVLLNVSSGMTVTGDFTTGDIAVAIPDLDIVEIPVSVSGAGILTGITADVRLNHGDVRDLVIELVSPAGTRVPLAVRQGPGATGLGNLANSCAGAPTRFSDAAGQPIADGAAPFAAFFRPDGNLSDFLGSIPGGTWKLRIADVAFSDSGTVGCVTLHIARIP